MTKAKDKVKKEARQVFAFGEDSGLRLTDLERRTLELHESHVHMQGHISQKIVLQRRVADQEYRATVHRLEVEAAQAQRDGMEARAAYNEAIAGIERRLGIRMKEFTIREDNALIYVREDAPPNGPAS